MRWGIVWIVLAAGCDLYLGGGGADDVCFGGSYSNASLLRDPATGTCEQFGGSYCPCEGHCAPTGELIPNWPACDGPCDGLAEQACLSTATCHATYQPSADRAFPQFLACWSEVGNTAAIVACAGLDAYACAQRDDCASLMNVTAAGESFASCITEPPGLCLVDTDCPDGTSCDTTTCHQAPCPNCPECGACAPTCFGVCAATPCEQLTETACQLRSDCDAVYVGTDCTCDEQGVCHCQNETYDHCEAVGKL